MKDSTLKNYARQYSVIQFIDDVTMSETGVPSVSGLINYRATCILDFRGQMKEFFVSTWQEEKRLAEKELKKIMSEAAFEILKYQFKIK